MNYNEKELQRKTKNKLATITENVRILGILWLVIIGFCIINRDWFTVDNIVNKSPANTSLAVLLLLLLFALKSLSVVMPCGILYAASGLLFPLCLAIPVSAIGTAIMITLPYFIGRRYGIKKAEALMDRYPRLLKIHELRRENDFFFSFIIRFAGRLPSDPVSLYMGATNTKYVPYIGGSLLGMLPSACLITVIGTKITDFKSPVFVWAVVAEVLITVVAMIIFFVYTRKKLMKNSQEQGV